MKRDLGVDGDFERKRQEIMVLWQSCNVSLVRRTYFYMLFKGDEADSVYIGVVLRRLLFIKDRFSQRKKSLGWRRNLNIVFKVRYFFWCFVYRVTGGLHLKKKKNRIMQKTYLEIR